MKKKKMKDKSYEELMDELLACKTPEEAKAWVKVAVKKHATVFGYPEVESARVLRKRLRYMISFYDDKKARRAQKLLDLTYPILLRVGEEKSTSKNAKKAFEAGAAFGKKKSEIRVRAWDKALKLMQEDCALVSYGEHRSDAPDAHIFNGGFGAIICTKYMMGECVSAVERDPSEVELMLYIGLRDKNGQRIYVGDIVKYKFISGNDAKDEYLGSGEDRVSEVKFRAGKFYPIEEYWECEDWHYSWRNYDFEVIGNIYENPELLR